MFALSGRFPGRPGKPPSEGVTCQEVKDGVNTAVEAGQAPRHLVSGINLVVEGTHIWGLKIHPGP